MYGPPIHCSQIPPASYVIHPVWNYVIKKDGTYRACNCMNGKQLTKKGVQFVNTYSTCIEQPCIHLYFTLCTFLGYTVHSSDVVNAYAHANWQGQEMYVNADDPYYKWYENKFGIKLEKGMVCKLQKAMQGHPEAGNWWANDFQDQCTKPLRLKSTRHEPDIYSFEHTSGPSLVLQQVDDILSAATNPETIEHIFNGIEKAVKFKCQGLCTTFFATDIKQTWEYIKLYAKTYLTSCLT